MKKIVFCLLAIVAAHGAFAAKAWYSEEINAILAKMPSKYYTNVEATLWGSFGGGIWTPPYAKYSYVTGKIEVDNANSFEVTSYATLNKYGEYDVEKSLDNFFDNCGSYITDDFDQPYTMYDESVAAFYVQYEQINFAEAKKAFDSLQAAFEMWRSDVISSTTTLGTDVGKIAELTKEIEKKLGDAKEEIAQTVNDTKKVSENLNNELKQVQEDLTKISEEAVYNAQKKIESTVSDFNSFVNKLETAIELEEWDDTAFESAFSELTKSEQDLVDAITELQKSSGNAEAQQAITVLNGQLTGIRSLKTSLRTAITNKDKSAASAVLASARGTDFTNSRKAASKVNNKLKELKSKAKTLDVLVKAALATMSEQDDFAASLAKMREAFSAMFITSMDNFHQINAFLGSTNSMEYLDKRRVKENATLADFTTGELARWVSIKMQDPLFRDSEDAATYETIGRLGKMGGTYNNIFRLIGSTYFTTYMDLEWMDRFMHTYDQGSFKKENIRGFYAEEENEGGNTVTNWYAGHITAPKNWADGTSIIVTNGQFKAVASVLDHQSVTTNDAGAVEVYGFSSNTTEVGMVPYKKGENELGWKYVGVVDCVTISTNETEHADEAAIKGFYEPETENGMVPYKKSATELGWKNVGGADADDSSVTTNTAYGAVEQGKVSIYGFSSAPTSGTSQMSIPVKMENGKIEWKPLYTMTVVTRSNYSTVSHKFENFTKTFYVVADSEPGESSTGTEVFTAVECPPEP